MARRKWGGLYKRKDSPYWWLWYYEANGNRKEMSTGTGLKGAAQDILDKKVMGSLLIREGVKTETDILLSDLIDEYLKFIKARKGYHTLRSYKTILEKSFLKWTGLNNILKAVDVVRSSLDGYVTYLRQKGLKGQTCNNHIIAIRAMFYWAVDIQKYMSKNPAKKMKMMSMSDSRSPRPLDEAEYKVFFQLCLEYCPQFYPLFYMMLHTGLRLEELINLKWADIDTKEKVIRVMKPKGERSVELVPMHPSLIRVVEGMPRTADHVFVDEKNRSWQGFNSPRRYRDGQIRRAAYAILEKMGITMRLHDIRHTFGSMLVHKGVDAFTVKDLMRHTNIKTTQRYVKLFGTKLHSSIDKLQELDN